MKVSRGRMEAIKALIECDMPYTLHFGDDVDDTADPSIDEDCIGCCKVVDIAADLQRKVIRLESMLNSDSMIIRGMREQIKKQATSIDGLIKNDERMKEINKAYLKTIDDLRTELIDLERSI